MEETGIIKETIDAFLDSYRTMGDSVATLTKIVQRQQEQIYKLEERIEVLEKRN